MGPDYDDEKWATWKEHSNAKYEKSAFKYEDSTEEVMHKPQHFPDVGYQELPEKE